MVGVAVVGVGNWGKNLVRNFASVAGAELRYVCDLDEKVQAYVAISREEGAGGSEIAQLVGKELGWDVLDKNLLDIPTTEISSSRVQLTVFDGQEAYDATKDPTGEEAIEDKYAIELDLSGNAGYRSCSD